MVMKKMSINYNLDTRKNIYHTNDDADGSRDPTAEYTDKLKKYGE